MKGYDDKVAELLGNLSMIKGDILRAYDYNCNGWPSMKERNDHMREAATRLKIMLTIMESMV